MKYFCSKDCPDGCSFEILKDGSFSPVANSFDEYPFFCSKLRKFYKRESERSSCFYKKNNSKVECDYNAAIDKMSEMLRASKKILYLRGSGSLGYKMKYWDCLFSKFENCYIVSDNPCDETGVVAHEEDFGVCTNPSVENLKNVDTIIIFGRNARVTNQHLYAFLKNIKKEIIYIDPVKSETTKLAGKYIRINPASDGVLCNYILGSLGYVESKVNLEQTVQITGISKDDIELLKSKIQVGKTGFITGFGLQRYSNGKNAVQWINRLAYYTGNIDNLYYGKASSAHISGINVEKKNKITIKDFYEKLEENFFDLIVIVGANPVVTYPESLFLRRCLEENKLVVVDTNITETVKLADIFVKVGGMFAQDDILGSYFFDEIINKREKYLDGISDTDVVKELSNRLGLDMEIKSVDEMKYDKKPILRKFNDKEIKLLLPFLDKGLRMITNSHTLYLNSQLSDTPIKEDYLHISEYDAKANGISDGETVELFNELGQLKIKAKISDKVAKGYIMIYKSRNYFGETPNILTKMVQTDANMAVSYYDTFVNIRRV
ncbi:molybdopterin-dependent oxidoreductase [Deferribacteraceae bacterium V6Fe1]|nr:molybdopterin-dependent oxidoreductase [Deferribacteraceae bacterium V6Fe1]